MMPSLELLLLGALAALSLVAGIFFFKFWRKTRDSLFLAFAASFTIRAFNDAGRASMAHPNEGALWSYMINIGSSLLILIAIATKTFNRKK